jgi:hypothetical protein
VDSAGDEDDGSASTELSSQPSAAYGAEAGQHEHY